jgi:ComF family protein
MAWTIADVTNTFFPTDCRVCGAPMVALGKVRVCELCLLRAAAQPDTDVLCTRCGDALGMESARFAAAMGVTECSLCRMTPPEFERAVAFGSYDHEMREMLHLLKFGGQRRMAEHVLGERLATAVLKLETSFDSVATPGKTQIPFGNDKQSGLLVVPVPLFPARERQRGFNQARLLAEAAVKKLRKQRPEWKLRVLPGAMRRVRDTHALFTMNPGERRRNLSGAFRVADKEAVRGRGILLIDDIMTTGATARECARVLRRAGAAKVWVATVARAQAESVRGMVPADVAMWGTGISFVEPDVSRRVSF